MRHRSGQSDTLRQWLARDWRAMGERWRSKLDFEFNPFRYQLEALEAGRPVVVHGWEILTYPGVSVSPYDNVRVEPDGSLTKVRGVDFVGAHHIGGRRHTGRHIVGWVPIGSSAPERVGIGELPQWVDDPENYEQIPRWEALRAGA